MTIGFLYKNNIQSFLDSFVEIESSSELFSGLILKIINKNPRFAPKTNTI
jgi:hypothetical protein